MKTSLWFLALVLSIGGIISFGFSASSHSDEKFSFSVGECVKDVNPHSGSTSGIIGQKFDENGKLVINGFIKGICSGDSISGDLDVEEDSILLFYSIRRSKTSDLYANGLMSKEQYRRECSCSQRVQYTIQNIEKKQYTVSIRSH